MTSPTLRALLLPGLLLLAVPACNRVETRPQGAPPSPARSAPPAAAPAPRADAPEGAPNVLLVTIDTLRADRVGAYGAGEGRTPTLDALAERGVVFERAFSTAPLTLPAHVSVLTGRYPPSHGVRYNALFHLEPGMETLAERLRAAGWSTGAVIGAVVLTPSVGLDQGFDHYDAEFDGRAAKIGGFLERPAEEVTDAALRWLEDAPRPFFLWVHYYDPHLDYRAPPHWRERFPQDPYAAEIAYTDAQLGRLLEGLREDEAGRTVVAAVADHGESLGEHGEPTHSYTLYDATQHVPFVVAGPGVPRGERLGAVVSVADVAPTLLALLDQQPLEGAEGLDLVAWMQGREGPPEREAVYMETLAPRLEHGLAPAHAARSERWHAVRSPTAELYDVREDPAQLVDLVEAEGAEVPSALEETIETALADAGELEIQQVDDATRAQLEALGYAIPSAVAEGAGEDGRPLKDALADVLAYATARKQFLSGRMLEADRLSRELVDRLPESLSLRDLRLRIALALNQPQEAIRHAQWIHERSPDDATNLVLLGYARLGAADLVGAVAAFERAAELRPDDPEMQVALMWRGALHKEPALAEQAASRALAAAPEDAEVAALIADNWDRMGLNERALEAYRRTLELDPEHDQARVGLAVCHARRGDVEEARRWADAAGDAAWSIVSRMRIALALDKGGAAERAAHVLRGILEERPDFEPARRELRRIEARGAEQGDTGVS